MRELFHEIGSSLRNNKLRTALTGFAVSWGIFLLIALLGAGNGLMNSFIGNLDDYISQSITVEGWRTSKPYAGYKEGRDIQLDEGDLLYTQNARWDGLIENVSRTTGVSRATLSYNGKTVAGSLRGVMPDYQEQEKIRMAVGRFLNPDDIRERRKIIVISMAQAKELLPNSPENLIGRWVNAGTIAYRIVGIYSTDESNMTRLCPIPYSTYKGIYDTSDKIESISFTVNGPKTLKEHEAFEELYTSGIKARHERAPDDRRGLWINNGYTDNMQMNKAERIIRIALWILGILTLISGIVGVSNIMLITVKERTHEFGIRKAIGAKPWNILKLIIIESVIITTFFGYVGMLFGVFANEYMDATIGHETIDTGLFKATMFLDPTVGLDVCIEATMVMIIAGTIAGLIPAYKASRIRPIEALRAD